MKHNKMGRIIAIANQKGGVGKTTTAINLAASLAALGKRVLLMDLDPQGNATSGMGVDKHHVTQGMYELLLGECTLSDAIQKTAYKHLYILPTTMDLAGAEVELIQQEDREYALRRACEQYQGKPLDYVLIDCPPSLNILTINALSCAHRVMITMQAEFYALEGLSQLVDSIRRVRSHLNPQLLLDGILLTMLDRRNNLTIQVEQEVRQHFKSQVYQQTIPRNIRLSEAPSYGVPALYHNAHAKGTQAYLTLAKEIIQRRNNEERKQA